MKKKKILLVGPFPPPLGGQSVLVSSIYEGLRDSDYGVEYLNISHKISNPIFRMFRSILWVFQLLSLLLLKRPSLVHIHTSAGFPLLEKMLFSALARLLGVKVILHIHGGKMRSFWKRRGKCTSKLMTNMFNYSVYGLIVLGDGWKDFYRSQLGYVGKLYVFKNAVKIPGLEKKSNKSRESMNDPVKLVFLGSVCIAKGVNDLAIALSMLKETTRNISLDLVGEMLKSDEEEIKKNYASLKSVKVTFCGVKSGLDKWLALDRADIFVLPSHSEDLPISIIEAMCLGKPIIATKVGVVDDLVSDNVNGFLVAPKSPDALVSKIQALVESHELRESMGQESILRSKAYCFERYMSDLIHVYNEALQFIKS